MKPFNIKEAKEGKPVCTRDGKPVRILCLDKIHPGEKSIIALVKIDSITERVCSYSSDGTCFDLDGEDIFMVGEINEGYVNLYKEHGKNYVFTSPVYKTLDEAIRASDTSDIFLGTSKIQWEE